MAAEPRCWRTLTRFCWLIGLWYLLSLWLARYPRALSNGELPGVSLSLQTYPFLHPTEIQFQFHCNLLQPTLPRYCDLTALDSTARRRGLWLDQVFIRHFKLWFLPLYVTKYQANLSGLFSLRRPIHVRFGDATTIVCVLSVLRIRSLFFYSDLSPRIRSWKFRTGPYIDRYAILILISLLALI